MQGRLTISSEAGFGSQFCAELPLPCHTRALAPPPLQGKVVAITAASSGLAELLGSLLPGWGLDYQQRAIDDSLLGLDARCADHRLPRMPVQPAPDHHRADSAGDRLRQFPAQRRSQRPRPFATTGTPLGTQCAVPDLATNPAAGNRHPSTIPSSKPRPRSDAARVLLVEDNPVNQLVAKGMLGKLGCDVIVAAHGAEALDQLE